jgi:hypothetical protein
MVLHHYVNNVIKIFEYMFNYQLVKKFLIQAFNKFLTTLHQTIPHIQ